LGIKPFADNKNYEFSKLKKVKSGGGLCGLSSLTKNFCPQITQISADKKDKAGLLSLNQRKSA
jgi:hypothetical protein